MNGHSGRLVTLCSRPTEPRAVHLKCPTFDGISLVVWFLAAVATAVLAEVAAAAAAVAVAVAVAVTFAIAAAVAVAAEIA